MRVAVRSTSWFKQHPLDEFGRVTGSHSGAVLVRRLLKMFEHPILIWGDWDDQYEADGFTCMGEKRAAQSNDIVVINMDVIDSLDLHARMKDGSHFRYPKIVNFVWWNLSEFPDKVDKARLGQSTLMMPTLFNSHLSRREHASNCRAYGAAAQQVNQRWAVAPLGIDVDLIPHGEDKAVDEPLVIRYPGSKVFARKQPELWVETVSQVLAVRDHAFGLIRADGEWTVNDNRIDVKGLLPSKNDYYAELATQDVFLSTSLDESYGLAYLELLAAGAVGVFLDRPWVHEIVPHDYPFIASMADLAAMLDVVVNDHAGARALIRGTDDWVRENHDSRQFGTVVKSRVGEWFV